MTSLRTIDDFSGEYDWLSNFYPSVVILDMLECPTVEHGYQAAKTLLVPERLVVIRMRTPAYAKKAGRKVTMRPDWDKIKIEVMEGLLRQKFARADLKQKLIETGQAELIEGNWWGDTFWGSYRGRGYNHLGKLLMKIRDDLAA